MASAASSGPSSDLSRARGSLQFADILTIVWTRLRDDRLTASCCAPPGPGARDHHRRSQMNLRRACAAVGLTTAIVSGTAIAASAITGGELDGNGHPNVGMIAYYDSTGRFRCTATLVSPTVLVTAAH